MESADKAELIKEIQESGRFTSLPESIMDKAIEAVYPLMPSLVVKKIKRLEFKTIRDMLCLHPYKLISANGMGEKSLTAYFDFLLSIADNPDLLNGKRNDGSNIKSTKSHPELFEDLQKEFSEIFDQSKDLGDNVYPNLIEIFIRIYKRYCAIKRDPKIDLIISKRFLQSSEKFYTLQELGLALEVSRERIRQLESATILNLSKFLGGKPLHGKRVKLNFELVEAFTRFSEFVAGLEFKTKEDFLEIISNKFSIVASKQNERYLELMLRVFGFEFKSAPSTAILLKMSSPIYDDFSDIIDFIFQRAKEEVNPLPFLDILISVRSKSTWKSIPEKTLNEICKNHPCLSTIVVSGEIHFQIKFQYLSSFPDRAFVVLKEIGKPTHFKEIEREVFRRLHQLGVEVGISDRTSSKFSNDPRFTPIGRSGLWGLAEWSQEGKTIKELIIEFLIKKNQPSEKRDITAYVLSKREVPSTSVASVISSEVGKTILVTDSNLVILKDWQRMYKVKKNAEADSQSYVESAIPYLLKNPDGVSRDDLIANIKASKPSQRWNISQTFAKHPAIKTDVREGKKYFSLVPNYERFIYGMNPNKNERCKESIVKMLSLAENKTLPLKELKEKVSQEIGCHRVLVYKVIDENIEFKKIVNGPKNVLIQLRGVSAGVSEIAPSKSELELLLEGGETSTLELKSSLRFDYLTGKKNQELEMVILKTIAGFANSAGGTLIIGVADNNEVLGLEKDFSTFSSGGNRDVYERHLCTIISNAFGRPFLASSIRVMFELLKGKEICRVKIEKSDHPLNILVSEEGKKAERFFVRMGNSTREISNPSELYAYFQKRFYGK